MTTLGYWGFRGLAQPIRFLLAYLGVKFTDKHYASAEEWFQNDKNNLGLEFPNLPYLIDEENKVTESSAIPVYLAKKYNQPQLLGQSADGTYSALEVKVATLLGVLRDFTKEFLGSLFNPQFETLKEQVYTDKLAKFVTQLVAALGNNDFLAGSLTVADFTFYELLNYLQLIYPQQYTETLKAYVHRFESLPGIKEYLAAPSVNLKVFLNPAFAAWSGPK